MHLNAFYTPVDKTSTISHYIKNKALNIPHTAEVAGPKSGIDNHRFSFHEFFGGSIDVAVFFLLKRDIDMMLSFY